jgi:hypothetical protein
MHDHEQLRIGQSRSLRMSRENDKN